MTTYKIHLETFRTEPAKTECRESVWSEGASCAKCWHECYRAGWDNAKVDADNLRRVLEKRKERENDNK